MVALSFLAFMQAVLTTADEPVMIFFDVRVGRIAKLVVRRLMTLGAFVRLRLRIVNDVVGSRLSSCVRKRMITSTGEAPHDNEERNRLGSNFSTKYSQMMRVQYN